MLKDKAQSMKRTLQGRTVLAYVDALQFVVWGTTWIALFCLLSVNPPSPKSSYRSDPQTSSQPVGQTLKSQTIQLVGFPNSKPLPSNPKP